MEKVEEKVEDIKVEVCEKEKTLMVKVKDAVKKHKTKLALIGGAIVGATAGYLTASRKFLEQAKDSAKEVVEVAAEEIGKLK